MYRACWVVQVPVGMRGHAEDVKVAVADLEYEQDVEPAQRHRTVDVENVDGQHAGGLRAQELASWVSVLRDGAGGIRWWPAGPIRVGPVLAYELAPTSELTLLGEQLCTALVQSSLWCRTPGEYSTPRWSAGLRGAAA